MKNSSLADDFWFVVNSIKPTHPLALSRLPNEFNEYINKAACKIDSKSELLKDLCILTALLQDGHTNIEIEYSIDDLCLNLPCIWLNDGLYATADYYGVLKGDKIVGIGHHDINQVLERICAFIPHENNYLVKVRATTYPFINYHIFSEFMLNNIEALNCKKTSITVLRKNQVLTYDLSLEKYNGFLDFKNDENFINFWIKNSSAILKLDECRYNDEYIKGLGIFFSMVMKQNIHDIIIDIRKNMGGDSRVITEFLKYIDVNSYYFYGVKVRNQNEKNLIDINSENSLIYNNTYKNIDLFKGKITCLVSNKTFSSAGLFATVLKDNNIAVIAGEPTGGKPSSYGNPLHFKTPNLNIKFRVSSRIFTRPANNGQDDITLHPDIPVYPTIEDVLCGNDTVLNKVLYGLSNNII